MTAVRRCTTLGTQALLCLIIAVGLAHAQKVERAPPDKPRNGESPDSVTKPITALAIEYAVASRSTPIQFRGTNLLPDAEGNANVYTEDGFIRFRADFKHLPPANVFGAEYLTYVMWAVTPAGITTNIGEVRQKKRNRGSIVAIVPGMQVFALVITAEPYFFVQSISDLIVMEAGLAADSQLGTRRIDNASELIPRGRYETLSNPQQLKPVPGLPLDLYQARNAVQIVRNSGTMSYAPDLLRQAEVSLQRAERYVSEKGRVSGSRRDQLIRDSRAAVQFAEAARITTKARQEEERQLRERFEEIQKLREENKETQLAYETRLSLAEVKQQTTQIQAERFLNAAKAAQQRFNLIENDLRQARFSVLRRLNEDPQALENPRGLHIDMSKVDSSGWGFETGGSTPSPQAMNKLVNVAGILACCPDLMVRVEGHTDDDGTERDKNQIVSQRRADAVREFLIQQGLKPERIVARGLGTEMPLVSNDTEQGRRMNRRVSVVLYGNLLGQTIGACLDAACDAVAPSDPQIERGEQSSSEPATSDIGHSPISE